MTTLAPVEEFAETVEKIGGAVSRDYPGVDAEDISQHLYLTILEHRHRFRCPDDPGVTGALWRIARTYATQLRAEGLHLSVQYAYRPEDVRRMLEHTFDRATWPDTPIPDDARSLRQSADELDLQSDLSWAWSTLSTSDRAVILRRYGLKEDLTSSQRTQLSRAVDRLVDVLNTYPRPGLRRRAVSNVHAQHIIGGSYE